MPRDDERQQFKQWAGKKAAWAEAVRSRPRQGDATPKEAEPPPQPPAPKRGPVNFKRDVEWAYSNLEVQPGTEGRAPSAEALALLKWARVNRDGFFQNFAIKVLGTGKKADGRERRRPGGMTCKEHEEVIDKILADIAREAEQKKDN